MMKREDWRNWCAWRALEETDREAERLARPVRVEATAQSAGGLKSDQVVGLKPEVVAFLTRRCARLRERAEPATVKWVEARRVPRLPGMWVMGLLAAAAVVGFVLTQLGQERELNLLALPLVGVLVWNAIVMLVAVVGELWPERKGAEPSERDAGWLVRMVRRRVETEADGEEGLRFWQLTGPTALRLVAVNTLSGIASTDAMSELLEGFDAYPPSVKRGILQAMLANPERTMRRSSAMSSPS